MAEDRIDVLVTVLDADGSIGTATLDALQRAGLEIKNVMDEVGVVSGSIERGRLAGLCKVGNVEVEESRGARVPPPDSEVQ